jgi:CHASE2 domain-containing sensor protein
MILQPMIRPASLDLSSLLTAMRGVLIGLVCGLFSAGLVLAGGLEALDLMTYDRILEWRGQRAPTAPIVIVAVDESSFAELNTQWPFPRAMHAEVVDRISAARPVVIAVDFLFDAPSLRGPKDDDALAAAIARAGNVVLGAGPMIDWQSSYVRFSLNWPIGSVGANAAAIGAINMQTDPDGRIRRASATFRSPDKVLPTFAGAVYRLVQSAEQRTAILPPDLNVLINFRGGRNTFPWLPYHDVLRGKVTPESLRGRIVLIGATSDLVHDMFGTPFARTGDMPGIEIHANAIDSFITGDYIRELPPVTSAAAAIFVSVAVAVLVVRLPMAGVPAVLGALVVMGAAGYCGLAVFGTWFRLVGPAVAMIASLIFSLGVVVGRNRT